MLRSDIHWYLVVYCPLWSADDASSAFGLTRELSDRRRKPAGGPAADQGVRPTRTDCPVISWTPHWPSVTADGDENSQALRRGIAFRARGVRSNHRMLL